MGWDGGWGWASGVGGVVISGLGRVEGTRRMGQGGIARGLGWSSGWSSGCGLQAGGEICISRGVPTCTRPVRSPQRPHPRV